MISYATWAKYKAALANETWTAWVKWPKDVQDAMREVEWAHRQYLSFDAVWCDALADFWNGAAYRVNPAWHGPAKPEPVAEYEDCKVDVSGDGSAYMYTYEIGSCTHKRILSCAIGNPRFAGYVYTGKDGNPVCSSALFFDGQADGTWHLRVPVAVRLRKDVVR